MAELVNNAHVHMHYTCRCSIKPEPVFDAETQIVNIPIKLRCPSCRKGRAKELIVGGAAISITKCPHPGCRCTGQTCRMPIEQFRECLNA